MHRKVTIRRAYCPSACLTRCLPFSDSMTKTPHFPLVKLMWHMPSWMGMMVPRHSCGSTMPASQQQCANKTGARLAQCEIQVQLPLPLLFPWKHGFMYFLALPQSRESQAQKVLLDTFYGCHLPTVRPHAYVYHD